MVYNLISKTLLGLIILFNIVWASASEGNIIVQMDQRRMPRCLSTKEAPNKAIFLYWNPHAHTLPRQIYAVKTTSRQCQHYLKSGITKLDGRAIHFQGNEAPYVLNGISLDSHTRERLSEIRRGINRHINPEDSQDENYLKNLFEPFKAKTNENLISDYHIIHSTKLYHAWINNKNLTSNCSELIGTCDYYLCRETQKSCSANGYFLGFGYQYCSDSLVNVVKKVSPLGEKWLNVVATCLQKKMENISNDLSCSTIKKKAIGTHDDCYSEISFCSLEMKDIYYILKMISPELDDWRILREGFEVLQKC